MENTQVLLNIVWTMVGAFLVFFMHGGDRICHGGDRKHSEEETPETF